MALNSRLETLDSEIEEVGKESKKALNELSTDHNQQLEIIKDFGELFNEQFLYVVKV